jgi:hypothetical protein
VTVARRLAALETSLGPTERVLAWLDEAQAFGSLTAYVDSLLDQPPETFPINRLAREAASAARTEMKRPAEAVDEAVRRALRATIFRFELVVRINVLAHEMIDREALIYAALAGQLAILVSDERTERRSDPAYSRRMAQCRDISAGRVVELLAAQEARSIVEQRYLGGHPALFLDGIDQSAEQLRLAQGAGGHGRSDRRARRGGSRGTDGSRCVRRTGGSACGRHRRTGALRGPRKARRGPPRLADRDQLAALEDAASTRRRRPRCFAIGRHTMNGCGRLLLDPDCPSARPTGACRVWNRPSWMPTHVGKTETLARRASGRLRSTADVALNLGCGAPPPVR